MMSLTATTTTPSNVTSTATSISLLTITTPWVEPPDCSSQWTTSTVSYEMYGGTTVTQEYTISNPAATCYPSGWDGFAPEHRLRFRPGVCPDGWVYNDMAEHITRVVSTAHCCLSGFDRLGTRTLRSLSTLAPLCAKSEWTTAGTRSGPRTLVHDAWIVTWAKSDTATLTPKLPTLTSGMTVMTWTPGEKIPKGRDDANRVDNGVQYMSQGVLWFLMVGMPIIGALMISSCVWCCVRKCKKNRRERRAIKAAAAT